MSIVNFRPIRLSTFSPAYTLEKQKQKTKNLEKENTQKKKPDQCFNLIAIPLFATPLFFL